MVLCIYMHVFINKANEKCTGKVQFHGRVEGMLKGKCVYVCVGVGVGVGGRVHE